METLWNNLKKGLQEGVAAAVSKAEELSQLGRARLDIAATRTRIYRLQAELGALVYRYFREEKKEILRQEGPVQALCARLETLAEEHRSREAELEAIRAEIEQLREEGKLASPPPPDHDPQG